MAKSKDKHDDQMSVEMPEAVSDKMTPEPLQAHRPQSDAVPEGDDMLHSHDAGVLHDFPPGGPNAEPHMAHTPTHPVPENAAPTQTAEPVPHMDDPHHPPVHGQEMAGGSRYMLPRYKIHHEVYAAPIHAIDDKHIHVDGGDNPNVMQLVMVEKPHGIFERGEPALGDYLVIHKDGGMSWMPKRAFEAAHERLPDEVQNDQG